MLTDRELMMARSDVAEALVSTCVIERYAGSVDAYGIDKQTWSAHGTVACRIDPLSQRDSQGMVAGREAGRSYQRLTLAWNADVQEGDRIVFGSETLELVELQNIHDDRIVTRAILAKVEEP